MPDKRAAVPQRPTIGDLIRGLKDMVWPFESPDAVLEFPPPHRPEFRAPTAIIEEEERCMAEWETDIDATRIAWNVFLLWQRQQYLDGGDTRDLARAIQRYGDRRVADFQDELRRGSE